MYGENLPAWIIAIYYLLLLTTIGVAITCIFKRKIVVASLVTIVLSLVVQVVSILYGIDRASDHNELDHFLFSLSQRESWSIFVAVGYLYIVIWWIGYFTKKQGT